jgi:hypothetical protein
MQRTPWLFGRAWFGPACREGCRAEQVPDREELVVVGAAAGADCEMAGNPVARAAFEGADDVSADLAAPLRA